MNSVDICNRALARIGELPNLQVIDPPEGSVASELCARFYPMCVSTLLQRHEWSFATKIARLAKLAVEPMRWRFAYAQPNDCLRVLGVMADYENPATNFHKTDYDDKLHRDFHHRYGRVGKDLTVVYEDCEVYRIDNTVAILTDVEGAYLRYITSDVDTGKYSPLFTEALSLFLAVDLAGGIIKGDNGMKIAEAMRQRGELVFAEAVKNDRNQVQLNRDFTPEGFMVRR